MQCAAAPPYIQASDSNGKAAVGVSVPNSSMLITGGGSTGSGPAQREATPLSLPSGTSAELDDSEAIR